MMYPASNKLVTSRFSTHSTQKCEMATAKQSISGHQFWMNWGPLQSKTKQNHVILKIQKVNKNIKHR